MYWPITTARRLHTSPSGLHHEHIRWCSSSDGAGDAEASTSTAYEKTFAPEFNHSRILHTVCSQDGQLWAALTPDAFSVWSTRPAQTIAGLVRTPQSIKEYGANVRLHWRTDASGVLVETDASFMLLYDLHALPQRHTQMYSHVPSSGSGSRSQVTKEPLAPSLATLRSSFAPGAGEGSGTAAYELQSPQIGEAVGTSDGRNVALEIRFFLVLRIDAGLSTVLPTQEHLIAFTASPPAIQCIPWPDKASQDNSKAAKKPPRTSLVERLDWLIRDSVEKAKVPRIISASYCETLGVYLLVTSDGRAYWAQLEFDSRTAIWRGRCFHGAPRKKAKSVELARDDAQLLGSGADSSEHSLRPFSEADHAVTASFNARFNLLAVGLRNGLVRIYNYRAPDRNAPLSHKLSLRKAMRSTASYLNTGSCTNLAWSSDGHALAVGWARGWSVWSTFGKLMGCSLIENWQDASPRFSDNFMRGVSSLFWSTGDTELFLCCRQDDAEQTLEMDSDAQLFALPFAKSAVAGQHSPDNTRYAFVQMDDSLLVYRGSDQPDMSIINPESDVWHHIKIPAYYMAANWPIKYACISGDGRLIAVAGRRGLTHFSTLSGRWKQFLHKAQEQSFSVQGGLQWYQHVLVAACYVQDTNTHEIRLFSRDATLDESTTLYIEELSSAVVLTSLFDNSLLVYTADNTLHHYLIAILEHEICLTLCGSITFEGVVSEPERVRGMSWLVPYSQQRFGDPMDDLMLATIIFLIDGKLVLLRPRRVRGEDEEEVSYDMQILGDQIEYFWTHLQGVGTLENSLWGYDGRGIKLWLDALTIEQADIINEKDDDDDKPEYRTIAESVSIPLDFYPLCVLIEKGIIIGVEPEVSLRRSLDFAIFRSVTITKLFLQNVLRNYLERSQLTEAVLFASFYKDLVYFAHALEILLHDVLEDEVDSIEPSALTASSSNGSIVDHLTPSDTLHDISDIDKGVQGHAIEGDGGGQRNRLMPLVVEFLDHFDDSLEVVVNCARKTEVARWSYLFSHVGEPRELFEICLTTGNYKTAGSYLLVLHNLESIEVSHEYTVRLLKLAREHGWLNLCKDLLRFSRSLDEDGQALRNLIEAAGLNVKADVRPGQRAGKAFPKLGPGRAMLSTRSPLPSMSRKASSLNVLEVPIEEEEGDDGEPSARSESHSNTDLAMAPFTPGGSPREARIPRIGINGNILSPDASPTMTRFPTNYASTPPSRLTSANTAGTPAALVAPSRPRHGHVRRPDSISLSGRNASVSGLDSELSRFGSRPVEQQQQQQQQQDIHGDAHPPV